MCSSFPGLLIGRTAVHSGKDPAFVAYDQFLSTGILQPLSRGEVRCGSKLRHGGDVRCKTAFPPKAHVPPRSCYVARTGDASNRRDVAAEIETKLFVQRSIDRICRSDEEE